MQGQVGNISRKMESLRKNQKQMIEIKTLQVISRADMAEDRTPELKDMPGDISRTEKLREQRLKNTIECSRIVRQL